jgi:hypothetical protein
MKFLSSKCKKFTVRKNGMKFNAGRNQNRSLLPLEINFKHNVVTTICYHNNKSIFNLKLKASQIGGFFFP